MNNDENRNNSLELSNFESLTGAQDLIEFSSSFQGRETESSDLFSNSFEIENVTIENDLFKNTFVTKSLSLQNLLFKMSSVLKT